MSQQAAANGSTQQGAAPASDSPLGAIVAERPEVAVGAAFLGGLLVARIFKRLGR